MEKNYFTISSGRDSGIVIDKHHSRRFRLPRRIKALDKRVTWIPYLKANDFPALSFVSNLESDEESDETASDALVEESSKYLSNPFEERVVTKVAQCNFEEGTIDTTSRENILQDITNSEDADNEPPEVTSVDEVPQQKLNRPTMEAVLDLVDDQFEKYSTLEVSTPKQNLTPTYPSPPNSNPGYELERDTEPNFMVLIVSKPASLSITIPDSPTDDLEMANLERDTWTTDAFKAEANSDLVDDETSTGNIKNDRAKKISRPIVVRNITPVIPPPVSEEMRLHYEAEQERKRAAKALRALKREQREVVKAEKKMERELQRRKRSAKPELDDRGLEKGQMTIPEMGRKRKVFQEIRDPEFKCLLDGCGRSFKAEQDLQEHVSKCALGLSRPGFKPSALATRTTTATYPEIERVRAADKPPSATKISEDQHEHLDNRRKSATRIFPLPSTPLISISDDDCPFSTAREISTQRDDRDYSSPTHFNAFVSDERLPIGRLINVEDQTHLAEESSDETSSQTSEPSSQTSVQTSECDTCILELHSEQYYLDREIGKRGAYRSKRRKRRHDRRHRFSSFVEDSSSELH